MQTDRGGAAWTVGSKVCGYANDAVEPLTPYCIAHLLSLIPYDRVPRPKVAVLPCATEHAYDDEVPLRGRRFVPARY